MLLNERNALIEHMKRYTRSRSLLCKAFCKHGLDGASLDKCPSSCDVKTIRQYVASMENTIALHCLEGKSENVKSVTPKREYNFGDIKA